MGNTSESMLARKSRHRRVRRKISGTAQRPRLAVFRSAQHIYVQAIDDEQGHTLAFSSTIQIRKSIQGHSGNKASAALVGKAIAENLLKQSISSVVFDRGGFLYHGRIQALAEAAREAGLQF